MQHKKFVLSLILSVLRRTLCRGESSSGRLFVNTLELKQLEKNPGLKPQWSFHLFSTFCSSLLSLLVGHSDLSSTCPSLLITSTSRPFQTRKQCSIDKLKNRCWFCDVTVAGLYAVSVSLSHTHSVSLSIRQYELKVHTDLNMNKIYTGELGRLKSFENQKPWVKHFLHLLFSHLSVRHKLYLRPIPHF